MQQTPIVVNLFCQYRPITASDLGPLFRAHDGCERRPTSVRGIRSGTTSNDGRVRGRRRTDSQLPPWYVRTHSEPVLFARAIRELPQAVEAEVAYRNCYSDKWGGDRPVQRLRRAGTAVRGADGRDRIGSAVPRADGLVLHHQPGRLLRPIKDVLRAEELDGVPLADVVFGEIRQYRGGRVHLDVLFDVLSVDLPGRDEPLTMVVTTPFDFSGHAVYVGGLGKDGYRANSMGKRIDRGR